MDNIQDLLNSAIVKIKQKVMPLSMTNPDLVSSPSPPYEQLYPLLEVFDKGRLDADIQKQTQYIYDYIENHKGEEGHKDIIMHILTRLGPTPFGQIRLDRVYRFCKLNRESENILGYHKTLQDEINALSNRG